MSKQIERIFICLLWLLAMTLVACFWLNTFFGFNIFSAQHWQYLAYLQAAQTHVRTGFYTSIIVLMTVTIIGLYILMRPRDALRRLRHSRNVAQSRTKQPHTTQPVPETPTAPAPIAPARPMRPRAPINSMRTAQPVLPPINQSIAQSGPAPTPRANDFDEIKRIFTDAGYIVKHSPQIGNFKPALLAIGSDENLWIGGIDIDETPITTTTERMSGIFADTLDDIEININTFIVAPTAPISNPDILTFENMDQLRQYMSENKNIPPANTDGGQENFDAYSEYIDTVITYMDKI